MVSSRLQVALETIRGRYGPQALQAAGGLPSRDVLPTGLPALDQALAVGGLPRGRISVLRGRAGSGKRSLAQHCLAVASREGFAVYLDTSGGLDPAYLDFLGADLHRILVIRPQSPDEAGNAALTLVRASVPFLAMESAESFPEGVLTALPSASEQGGGIVLGIGERPRAALDESASLRLEVHRSAWRDAYGDITGAELTVHVTKNRLARPGARALIHVSYPHPVLKLQPVESILEQRFEATEMPGLRRLA